MKHSNLLTSVVFRSCLLLSLVLLAVAMGGNFSIQTTDVWHSTFHDGSAFWTAFLAFFTAALVAATILLWTVTRNGILQQGRDTFRALQIAQSNLIATNRTWLNVDINLERQDLQISDSDISTGLAFSIVNCGNSPALQIDFFAEMFNYAGVGNPADQHREICEAHRIRRKTSGVALFPNEKFPITPSRIVEGVSCSPAEFVRSSSGQKLLFLYISVCVDYTFPSDPNGRHQTAILYELRRTDYQPLVFEPQTVPVSALGLAEPIFFSAGRHAD